MDLFVAAISSNTLSRSDKDLLAQVVNDEFPDCSKLSQDAVELAFSHLLDTENEYLLEGIISTNVIYKSPFEFLLQHKDFIIQRCLMEDAAKAVTVVDDQRKDFLLSGLSELEDFDALYFYMNLLDHSRDPFKITEHIREKYPGLITKINTYYKPTDRISVVWVSGHMFFKRLLDKIGTRKVMSVEAVSIDETGRLESLYVSIHRHNLTALSVGFDFDFDCVYVSAEIKYEDGTTETFY